MAVEVCDAVILEALNVVSGAVGQEAADLAVHGDYIYFEPTGPNVFSGQANESYGGESRGG